MYTNTYKERIKDHLNSLANVFMKDNTTIFILKREIHSERVPLRMEWKSVSDFY